MRQYKQTLRDSLELGTWKDNRTGISSIALPYPAVFRHDMRTGFPILTSRQAPFKSAAGELCGFLRGYTSAADFRAVGCNYWNGNANEEGVLPNLWLKNPFRKGEDDLGPVYGAQWRKWPAFKHLKASDFSSPEAHRAAEDAIHRAGWTCIAEITEIAHGNDDYIWFKVIDQLGDCVRTIINNPDSRRILFHAWNPAVMDEITLPACHLLYQFLPNSKTKELGLALTIRSNDMPLGFPSNCVEAGLLLELVAKLTGYTATWLTIVSNDAHIYKNQLDFVDEYLALPEHPLPKLMITAPCDWDNLFYHHSGVNKNETDADYDEIKKLATEEAVRWLDRIAPTDFSLIDYKHGPMLKSPSMAV
ncbi:thymidylate synthase [Paraburkholderia sp. BCC1886]|uniref:thymidylate synthase n=1 Tax=Paraburkholderia sp. BCC1886 TaxID=2562670 RepID=UPI001182CC72|nr:thymidylate synthase [Paraburkholderia sp. BCC1886]